MQHSSSTAHSPHKTLHKLLSGKLLKEAQSCWSSTIDLGPHGHAGLKTTPLHAFLRLRGLGLRGFRGCPLGSGVREEGFRVAVDCKLAQQSLSGTAPCPLTALQA